MIQRTYHTSTPQETRHIAQELTPYLHPKDIILLKGDLGTGKSLFARALIQALCGEETEVPSPTFTLLQTYEAPRFTLWHFDLYRLNSPDEILEIGLEEAYSSGVSLIEWPERLGSLVPSNALEIELTYGTNEDERIIAFKGWNDRLPK